MSVYGPTTRTDVPLWIQLRCIQNLLNTLPIVGIAFNKRYAAEVVKAHNAQVIVYFKMHYLHVCYDWTIFETKYLFLKKSNSCSCDYLFHVLFYFQHYWITILSSVWEGVMVLKWAVVTQNSKYSGGTNKPQSLTLMPDQRQVEGCFCVQLYKKVRDQRRHRWCEDRKFAHVISVVNS